MPAHTKVAGQYKRVYNVWIKVDGHWVMLDSMYTKFKGKWKKIHTRGAVFSYTLTISSTVYNFNLRYHLLSVGWDGVSPVVCTVNITSTGRVLGTVLNNYAFSTGAGYPEGSTLLLNNSGAIAGRGGDGATGQSDIVAAGDLRNVGKNGSPAFLCLLSTTLNNLGGVIAGGGGGGGGGGTNDGGGAIFGNGLGCGTGGNGGGGAGGPSPGGVTVRSDPGGPAQGGSGNYPAPGIGSLGSIGITEGEEEVRGGKGGTGGIVGSSGAKAETGYLVSPFTGLPVYSGTIGGNGGLPAAAISGKDNITFTNPGTIIGAQL